MSLFRNKITYLRKQLEDVQEKMRRAHAENILMNNAYLRQEKAPKKGSKNFVGSNAKKGSLANLKAQPKIKVDLKDLELYEKINVKLNQEKLLEVS